MLVWVSPLKSPSHQPRFGWHDYFDLWLVPCVEQRDVWSCLARKSSCSIDCYTHHRWHVRVRLIERVVYSSNHMDVDVLRNASIKGAHCFMITTEYTSMYPRSTASGNIPTLQLWCVLPYLLPSWIHHTWDRTIVHKPHALVKVLAALLIYINLSACFQSRSDPWLIEFLS